MKESFQQLIDCWCRQEAFSIGAFLVFGCLPFLCVLIAALAIAVTQVLLALHGAGVL